MKIAVKTAATSEPVTLNEVKAQLNIFDAVQDTYLNRLIAAARETVEDMARRCLISRVLYGYLDAFPCDGGPIVLYGGALTAVASVKYTDSDSVEHTVDTATYYVDLISEPGRICLKDGESWPEDELRPANGVVVEFTCGWSSSASVPEKYRQAIMLLVGHWYTNREAVLTGSVTTLSAEIDFGVRSLIGLSSPLWI